MTYNLWPIVIFSTGGVILFEYLMLKSRPITDENYTWFYCSRKSLWGLAIPMWFLLYVFFLITSEKIINNYLVIIMGGFILVLLAYKLVDRGFDP